MATTAGTRAPTRRSTGTRIGPFRLERYLGGGEDTEVWRADGDGIVVALKLRRPGTDDPLASARLAREATVLRLVHHDALIGLFDAAEDDGEPYLAFVFHDGPTVAECIDDGRFAAAVAAATFAPVADALAALHRAGVVHRDVKPSNILLTRDGPLLIDAGLASFAGTTYDGWVDAAPAIAGTTSYLAPEADDTLPAPALDVYALGVSMIEAVTGRADAAAALDAPETVRALLAACTDADPVRRPTAAAVATALRALAGSATPPSRDARPAVIDLTGPEPVVTTETRGERATHTKRAEALTESGRSDELATLDAAARDGAIANELRAVVVTAPPGTGKSWLIDAAASRLERRGTRVVRAACSPGRGDVRVVASWLLDLGRDRAGVTELVQAAGAAPGAALVRALGLSTGSGGGGEAEVDPVVVADAMAAVLARAAPIVCIVEDLHHASLELLDLLSRLALRSGVPGALVCTSRPSWVDPDELGFEVLPLGPLAPEAIAALVADLETEVGRAGSGAKRADPPVADIVAVAGGNPLHAREAALALARGESLDSGSTLPELIASRFASYEPPLRDALGLAAACGDQFWPEALGRTFLDAVPELYRAGVARVRMSSTLTASTEAHFRHPLLREVAYASLDEARRLELHSQLGDTLDRAGAPPEIVAVQAGTAFRLGDLAAAPLAARAAADAGRDALDRLSLQAASEWIALLRETQSETEPGLADLLDTELALDRGEYDRARALVGPEPGRGALAARRLVLATRAAYATGELHEAAGYGGRARELLADRPLDAAAHALAYGMVLSRLGSHNEALTVLDEAASTAREAGELGLAARLAAEAAEVASDRVRLEGGYYTDAIERSRAALDELRRCGDRRRYVASMPAFVETLGINAPEEALGLAVHAAEEAEALGDKASYGLLAYSICDTAIETADRETLQRWLSTLLSAPLDAIKRLEAEELATVARALVDPSLAIDQELLAVADRFVELGEASRADNPEATALCSLVWRGHASDARTLFERRVSARLPGHMSTLYDLALRALEGPPWSLDGTELPERTTQVHYERALLHLLRGEQSRADVLFLERYDDRVRRTGSARQRLSPYFPGALVAALGPPATEPDVEWLLRWIHCPTFPGLWIVHRAICALLLSERDDPPEVGLADIAVALVASAGADDTVRRWIANRAEGSGARGDRAV